jgi:D-tyrosyl-tRNA(Tyr) deacylase
MRLVVQRVSSAQVKVKDEIVGKIEKGFMVLVGIGPNDTEKEADFLANKLLNLRIFEDENGKMNLSLLDVKGELLLISQFTLYGDCSKGNRPSFINARNPEEANELYKYFCNKCGEKVHVETGKFRNYMQVSLVNEGPTTLLLEK